jgi:GH25 family lysozyme M1 (1,4-beta-N-acetylmuramidase)
MAELIDVSNANGAVDWHAVRKAGVVGAFVKASEGESFTDRFWAGNRHDANMAGVRVGAYHFARPDLHPSTPLAEARHFVGVVGRLNRTDLRPVLDLEVATPELHNQELVWWCQKWSRYVRDKLGVWPLLYGSTSYLANLMGAQSRPILGGLWLASYGRNDGRRYEPTVPRPWKKYVAHQYCSVGHVAGVRGDVDRSYAPRLTPLLAHPVLGRIAFGGGRTAAA